MKNQEYRCTFEESSYLKRFVETYWWSAFAVFVGVCLTACTPVPLNSTKAVSAAQISSSGTELGGFSDQITRSGNGQSAFAQLVDGNQALGARLRLIEAAEETLDLQYFLIKPDLGGALISMALLKAADRGVRVRLLLDDVFTKVSDKDLALLDAHPNIEVRIFNPSARPGPKFMGFLTDFQRVNRRMHNKSFTADSAFSIVGGRNIADEYFQINTVTEFADFEMLVVGPAVRKISDTFDLFWNDGWAVPINQLRPPVSMADLDKTREELEKLLVPARDVYKNAVNDPYILRLGVGQEKTYLGYAEIVTDVPLKLKTPVRGGQRTLAETLLRRLKKAQHDVILLTPYFVPEDYGARLFSDLAARGVRVRIVTNSLESTNHTYVHAGYRRHRLQLLAAGVELYEVRADSLSVLGLIPDGDETTVTMHSKLAIIDGQEVFLGSLNLDPRSIKLNTEIGLFIQSRKLSSDLLGSLDEEIENYTYRLAMSESGELEWHFDGPGANAVTRNEPGATFFKRFVVGITALLSVEILL